jgi:hypothetical protein
MANDNFPPVQWLQPLEPFSQPQYIPGSPHNLPRRPDPAAASATTGRMDTPGVAITESHRYASFVSLALTIGTASTKFLDQPIGKRNFLGFRNASSAGQNIYIDFGTNASLSSWLALSAGQIVVFDTVVAQDDLYVIADAAGGILSYVYSTISG